MSDKHDYCYPHWQGWLLQFEVETWNDGALSTKKQMTSGTHLLQVNVFWYSNKVVWTTGLGWLKRVAQKWDLREHLKILYHTDHKQRLLFSRRWDQNGWCRYRGSYEPIIPTKSCARYRKKTCFGLTVKVASLKFSSSKSAPPPPD